MLVARRMSRDPIAISPEASIQQAIELMKEHSIRHLPVVDGEERLVGWVSDTDLRGVFIASMIEELTSPFGVLIPQEGCQTVCSNAPIQRPRYRETRA